jgi:hypothetical protein
MFPASYVSAALEMEDGRGAVIVFTDLEDRLRSEEGEGAAHAGLATQYGALRDELARRAEEQAAAAGRDPGGVRGASRRASWPWSRRWGGWSVPTSPG